MPAETNEIAEQPLAELAAVEQTINPPEPMPPADPPREIPAVDRLRAFEDEHFGASAVRIDGWIERGSGSPFQSASEQVRARHAALERLIETERKLAEAHTALLLADDEHEAALAALDKPDAPSSE